MGHIWVAEISMDIKNKNYIQNIETLNRVIDVNRINIMCGRESSNYLTVGIFKTQKEAGDFLDKFCITLNNSWATSRKQ